MFCTGLVAIVNLLLVTKMPSSIAHSVSGYVVSKFWSRGRNGTIFRKIKNPWLFYAVFVSNAPDLDFILQFFSDEKIHRSFTHSVTATLGVTFFAGLIGFIFCKSRWKQLLWITLIMYSLHLVLDAFTAGGLGMKLLWPFTENYYRFPFSLFPPVHHSRGLLDLSHIIFVSYELAYSVLFLWGLRKWQFFQKRVRKSVLK